MPIPLPIELRSRVVAAFEAGLGSMNEIAERFNVSVSSVSRWSRLSQIYGEANPKPHAGGPPLKIFDTELNKVIELLKEKPDRTLTELTACWNERHQTKVCRSSINRALLRAGITFKKRHSGQLSETRNR